MIQPGKSFLKCQTLNMISQVESFLSLDKRRTPEEGRRIQQPTRSVTINSNKDEDKGPKKKQKIFPIKPHLKNV